MINPEIKNLIFDLGGVILDLSVDHTLQAFSQLSGIDKEEVKRIYFHSPEFELYEKGLLSDDDFRTFVKKAYSLNASDEDIDRCWNAMLRGIPIIKLDLLKKLMKSYNVILLSNTNTIHLTYINEVILPVVAQVNSLDPYFHRTYYSHIMRKRKPDAEIFLQVLAENNLVATETLFLDDNQSNVEGAKALGINIVHITHPDHILEYFHA